MAYIKMAGLSDWSRLACMDPARLAEMHENAAELQAMMAGISLDDLEYLSTSMLEHLRNRLIFAGIVPHGQIREDAPEETKRRLNTEKLNAKRRDSDHLQRLEGVMARIEVKERDGARIRGSGNRGRDGYTRISKGLRRRLGLFGAAVVETPRVVASTFNPKTAGFKMPAVKVGIPCPSCGRDDSLRKARGGFVCLACKWGKEVATDARSADPGSGRRFNPYRVW